MNMNKDLILRTFEDLPLIIGDYFQNIPPAALDKRRAEGAWTLREHLYHIVGVQDMLYERMKKLGSEKEPVIAPYFPAERQEQALLYESVDMALMEYKKMRKLQAELIRKLQPADLQKDAKHAEYTFYNFPIIINHIIFHEYWHMYRIEELWLTRDAYLQ